MKTTPSANILRITAFAAALFIAATASAAQPVVTAQLEPASIALGDQAQLTLTVAGGDNDGVAPPTVPGLEFVATGQSSQYQSINGVATSSVSITYDVIPQHAGIFNIPSLSPGAQPLTLQVQVAQGPYVASGGGNPGVSNPPALAGGGIAGSSTSLSEGGAAFVRLRLPKERLYVGETVPAEIQVGLRPGMVAQLDGLPTLNGDAFTLNKLSSQPEQTQEVIGGQSYTVLTWHSVLSAVKPGDFSLTVETPLTVQVKVAPPLRPRPSASGTEDPQFDDFFNDSFLQNFFGGTTEKQITVSSEPDAITVLELPAAGRPADFSGAVGNFEISSELSATGSVAGDPLTLRLKVKGTGSFDRVRSGMLGKLEGWKTYRPTAKFETADGAGYGGEKDFEQAVIPFKTGRQIVPALSFSYFNPATRSYETKLTSPMSVEISPAPAGSMAAIPTPTPDESKTATKQAPSDGLWPNRVDAGDSVANLRPLYFQPCFLGGQGALALCFAGGFLLLRRRERSANDTEASRRQTAEAAIASFMDEMDEAARTGGTARFFSSARAAIQQHLAMCWHVTPSSITTADLDERLSGGHDEIRQVFGLADEAAYSGKHLTSADFQRWTKAIREQLSRKEAS
jgi:hypothetical protein